jgi:excisionase family DNA binding protein
MEKLLTVEDAANILGFKVVTLRKWIAMRKVGAVRVGARSVRIPERELVRLIDAGRVPVRQDGAR